MTLQPPPVQSPLPSHPIPPLPSHLILQCLDPHVSLRRQMQPVRPPPQSHPNHLDPPCRVPQLPVQAPPHHQSCSDFPCRLPQPPVQAPPHHLNPPCRVPKPPFQAPPLKRSHSGRQCAPQQTLRLLQMDQFHPMKT